jgi:hypothetical protein
MYKSVLGKINKLQKKMQIDVKEYNPDKSASV